jgi:hypothetical protein
MAQTFDLFLTYLSEKGEGQWEELKEAWRWLAGASGEPESQAWIAARDLEALGHIEVAWEQELAWCAAPPLLTMIPRSGGRVFLTGARTRHLESQLNDAAEKLDLWVDYCDAQRGPRTVYVACRSSEQIKQLSAALEVDYTYQVAEQIVSLLPQLPSYGSLDQQGELPRGLEAERFDVSTVSWEQSEARDAPGLYRVRTYSEQLHGLRHPTGSWTRVLKELGVYEVLRWSGKKVLRYSEQTGRLVVPVEARLPSLHARAVTLCSGRLPSLTSVTPEPAGSRRKQAPSRRGLGGRHGRGKALPPPDRPKQQHFLNYENVPASVAERVASALEQALQEVA